ncbi:MAG TPA: family 31 glucosidase, partial [Terrimesophilobacter sp.]|nr:family 31 glucosidase [Terrimesophilobacter sp.]
EQSGDPRVLEVYRGLTELRERLVPYLIEQAKLGTENSKPLLRALFFEWPHDERVWEFPLQYLLGDDILVSPVTEPGATEWSTYLPEGEWVDAWTGEAFDGGRVVERPVPIDVIPVYVRAESWERLRSVFTP